MCFQDLIKWFDYTVDKKTQIIKMVLYDLDVAENQYSQMYWCQMKTFDKLTGVCYSFFN